MLGAPARSGKAAAAADESHTAPAAAAMLSVTPTMLVTRRPSAGRNRKPVNVAPSAAPKVLTVYRTPVSLAARAASPTSQRTASGSVAPIAVAGIATRSRLETTRTGAEPLAGTISVSRAEQRLKRRQAERDDEGAGGDGGFEPRIPDERALARKRGRGASRQRRAAGKSAHEGRQHGADGRDGVAHVERQQPQPRHLVEQGSGA